MEVPNQQPSAAAVAATATDSNSTTTYKIDERVMVRGKDAGVIKFIGPTKFATGEWHGVVLDTANGKNDGSVNGVRYFECEPNFGVFVKTNALSKIDAAHASTKEAASTSSDNTHAANATSAVSTAPDSSSATTSSSPAVQSDPTNPHESYQSYRGIHVGERIFVSQGRYGTLRYIGKTGFKDGVWCGIELDNASGLNDGSVHNVQYFQCPEKHGVFKIADRVLVDQREHAEREAAAASSAAVSGINTPRMHAPADGNRRNSGGSTNDGGFGLHREGSQESLASRGSLASFRSYRSGAAKLSGGRLGDTSNAAAQRMQRLLSGASSGDSPSASRSMRTSNTSSTAPINTIEALRDELRLRDDMMQKLQKHRDFDRQEMLKAARQAEEFEESYNALSHEFETLKAAHDTSLQKMRTVQTQYDTMQKSHGELEFRYEDTKTRFEELEFKVHEETLSRELPSSSSANNNESTAERQEIERLTQALALKENKINQLTEQMQREQEAARRTEYGLADSASDAHNLLQERGQQITDERSRCVQLEKQLTEKAQRMEEFESTVANLKKEKQAAELQISAKNQTLDELNKKVADGEKQLKAVQDKHAKAIQHAEKQRLQLTEKISTAAHDANEGIIKQLQQKLDDKQKELEQYDAERVANRTEIELLSTQIRESQAQLRQVEHTNATAHTSLSEENEKLQQSNQQITTKISTLMQSLEHEKSQVTNVNEQLVQARARESALRDQLAGAESVGSDASNVIKQLNDKAAELEREKQAQIESFTQLQAKLSEISSERLALEKSLKQSNAKAETSAALAQQKDEELNRLKKETSTLQENLTQTKTERDQISRRITENDAEKVELMQKLEQLQTHAQQQQLKYEQDLESTQRLNSTTLKEETEKLQQSHQQILTSKDAEFAETASIAEAKISTLLQSLEQEKKQLATANEQLNKTRTREHALLEQLAGAESVGSDAGNVIKQLNDNVADLQREKEEQVERYAQLQAELSKGSAERLQLESTLKQLDAKSQTSAALVREKDAEINRLTQETFTLQENISQAEQKHATLHAKLRKEYENLQQSHEQIVSSKDVDHMNAASEAAAKISTLMQSLEQEKSQVSNIGEQLNAARAREQELLERLAGAENVGSDASNAIKRLNDSVAELRREKQTQNDRLVELQADLLKISTERLVLETTAKNLEESAQTNAGLVKEKDAELDRFKQETSMLHENLSHAKSELDKISRLSVEHGAEKADLMLKFEELQTHAQQQQLKYEQDLESSERLNKNLLGEEMEKLRAAAAADAEQQKTLLEEQRSSLNAEIALLSNNLQEQIQQNTAQTSRVEQLEEQIAKLTAELVHSDQSLMIAEKRAEETVESLRADSEKMLNSAKADAVTRLEQKTAEHAQQRAQLEKQFLQVNAERDKLRVSLEEAWQQLERARSDVKQLQNRETTLLAEQDAKLQAVQRDAILGLRNVVSETQHTLGLRTQALGDVQSKLTAAVAENSALSSQLERERTALDAVQLQLDNSIKKLAAAELRNKEMQLQTLTIRQQHENQNDAVFNGALQSINIAGAARTVTPSILADDTQWDNKISFLNSVIAQLQDKNVKLSEQVLLKTSAPPSTTADADSTTKRSSTTAPKRKSRNSANKPPPRKFCDFCDKFDLHDTEDCPELASGRVSPPRTRAGGESTVKSASRVRLPLRKYCDICDVFDAHDTLDCPASSTTPEMLPHEQQQQHQQKHAVKKSNNDKNKPGAQKSSSILSKNSTAGDTTTAAASVASGDGGKKDDTQDSSFECY